MAEIRTVTTLRYKQQEIETAIGNYEKRLAQARADLAHINAAIAIFEASGDRATLTGYVELHRLFKRGELTAMCKAALASGPLDTRAIASYVIALHGLDNGDKVLARAICNRIIHQLRRLRREGQIDSIGRVKAALVWRLPLT
jgi:hypothetical protein